MTLEIIYIYIYKQDLALNNLQWWICHKTQLSRFLSLPFQALIIQMDIINVVTDEQWKYILFIGKPNPVLYGLCSCVRTTRLFASSLPVSKPNPPTRASGRRDWTGLWMLDIGGRIKKDAGLRKVLD